MKHRLTIPIENYQPGVGYRPMLNGVPAHQVVDGYIDDVEKYYCTSRLGHIGSPCIFCQQAWEPVSSGEGDSKREG